MTTNDTTAKGEQAAKASKPAEAKPSVSQTMAMRRKIILGVAVVAFCFGVVAIRAVWQGRSALSDGDAAAQAGEFAEAVTSWRRAARWYVPLAPHVVDAYERLESLATEAESRGDAALALAAWRGVRGSILATRSFFTPQQHRLGPANQHIAALMAASESANPDSGETLEARTAWHLRLLDRNEAPSVGWALLALLGCGLWIGGGFYFAFAGVSADDRLIPRAARVAGVLVVVGLLLWMLGLYQA